MVEHSTLDTLYERTGNVLFVDKFAHLTEEHLAGNYSHFEANLQKRGSKVPEVLTRDYWRHLIERTRREAIQKYGLKDVSPRKRCWGLKD